MADQTLLNVRDLAVSYAHKRQATAVRALHGVSFTVGQGETVAVVGESGTGKSTIAGAVLGLVPVAEGSIEYDHRDITYASDSRRRSLCSEIQAVFQNPYSSFNPSRKIRDAVVEPLLYRSRQVRRDRDKAVAAMLQRVGLAADVASYYPRQLSGGQLQRIAIARALIASPRLVVLDEALSSLDLSVQAQIVNLLIELREELGLAYLFIAHDLDIVKHLAHRVLVLYRGHVVESGPAGDICDNPQHPYTRDLVSSVPVPDPLLQRQRRESRDGLRTAPPAITSVSNDGCPFIARCASVAEICASKPPPAAAGPHGSVVMCHRYPEPFITDPVGAENSVTSRDPRVFTD